MKITVQDYLNNIYNRLKILGYDVHYSKEGVLSDIYIYSENKEGLNATYNSIMPTNTGCLLINSDNKEIKDIMYSVQHRIYSPLF